MSILIGIIAGIVYASEGIVFAIYGIVWMIEHSDDCGTPCHICANNDEPLKFLKWPLNGKIWYVNTILCTFIWPIGILYKIYLERVDRKQMHAKTTDLDLRTILCEWLKKRNFHTKWNAGYGNLSRRDGEVGLRIEGGRFYETGTDKYLFSTADPNCFKQLEVFLKTHPPKWKIVDFLAYRV